MRGEKGDAYMVALETHITLCDFISKTVCVHLHLAPRLRMSGTIPPKNSPVTGPEGPRGLQEVKVPRFRDNGTGWW